MDNHKIRPADEADITKIRDIYSLYVTETTITCEITVPDIQEMLNRFRFLRSFNCPYIVYEIDNQIIGYAYASPYRSREAYRFTAEISIYLSDKFTGMNIGEKIFKALAEKCKERGFRQMISVVTGEEYNASFRFHLKMGFSYCGTLHAVAEKFSQDLDTHFFQKAT